MSEITKTEDNQKKILQLQETNRKLKKQLEKISEETKQLELKLRQANKLEAIGTLASGIAHDFNNILSIIIGNNELALDDVPKSNSAIPFLEEIQVACLRARDVVKQLLSFSRRTEQEIKPINISYIIREILKLLRASLPASVDIRQFITTEPADILADPTQIHQVMINLCTNAAQAMEASGGILLVRVENFYFGEDADTRFQGLKPGRYVCLEVRDSGEGIDPENMERIFDPYFTTRAVGKGSGMGLAVVHGIITDCGGEISVESELGNGTTVTVLFPALEKEKAPTLQESDELPRGNETVLFIDDEASIIRVGTELMTRLGYKVEAISNPEEALEIFKTDPERFDLAMIDMTMPLMNGDTLTREFLSIKPDLPVILCTGFSQRMDANRAVAQGIRALIQKPFGKNKVAHTLRSVLDQIKDR